MTKSFDVFLSYRHTQLTQVRSLRARLEAHGLTVWIDNNDIPVFSSLQRAIPLGVARSKALIAWYSDDYEDSEYCNWELIAAYIAAEGCGKGFEGRIFVLNPKKTREHISRSLLNDQVGPDCHDLDDAGWNILVEKIATAIKKFDTTLGEDSSKPAPSWIPVAKDRSEGFVGRHDDMWRIHAALTKSVGPLLVGDHTNPSALLVGMPGIGKSSLASQYAHLFSAFYPGGIFWLEAGRQVLPNSQDKNYESRTEFREIARSLGHQADDDSPNAYRAILRSYFEAKNKRFLWIVDDIGIQERLEDWLAPHPQGSTLFTAKHQGQKGSHRPLIQLEGLKEKDAYNLIRFSVSSPGSLISLDSVEEESAKKICKNLGCHPLAISVASGVKGNDVSFTSLLRQIEENPLNVIEPDDFELPLDHRRSIVKLFEISIARLSEDARTLLRIAHHVALVPIPRSLIQHSIVQLGCPSDRCEKVVSDSIGRLERHCLGRTQAPDVSRDFQGGLLIHGLVRQVINKISPPQVMDATLDAVELSLDEIFGEPFHELPVEKRNLLRSWRPHAMSCLAKVLTERRVKLVSNLRDFNRVDNQPRATLICSNYLSGFFDHNDRQDLIGAYQNRLVTASALNELRQFSTAKKMLTELDVAVTRSMGALSMQPQDALQDILAYVYRVATRHSQNPQSQHNSYPNNLLEVHENLLGSCRLEIANSLKGLGQVDEAINIESKVAQDSGDPLGRYSLAHGVARNNLGFTLTKKGDVQTAASISKRLLAERRTALTDNHQHTVESMNNHGGNLLSLGDFPGAQKLFEEALRWQILNRGLHDRHTLETKSNLATSLMFQKRIDRPLMLLNEIVESLENQDEPSLNCPLKLQAQHGIALLTWNKGEHAKARELRSKVEKTFVEFHMIEELGQARQVWEFLANRQ